MLSHEVSSLQKIPMFQEVDIAKLKLIALASQRTNYRSGDQLLKEGDRADTVFIILDGKAKVLRGEGESRIEIATVESGAVVGEMGVVLDRPYSGTIVADTPVTALRIDKRTFLDLLNKVPQLSMALIRELASRVLATSDLYVKAMSR
jgi:CRP/FNR family transcriptional regulator, cyclic AMP receptor protein